MRRFTVKPNPAQRRNIPFAGEQAQVLLGMPLIKHHDPDYYALVAGNYILGGGGFDSRLMKVLRDRYGYTYGVYSNLEPATEAGMFTIAYSTQKKTPKTRSYRLRRSSNNSSKKARPKKNWRKPKPTSSAASPCVSIPTPNW